MGWSNLATLWPPRGPARVVLLLDNRALDELVHLTLNHGVYSTRTVVTADQAKVGIDEWQPHLVIFDADLGGQEIMQHVAAGARRLPTIALSRRGDLKTKLAAFEWIRNLRARLQNGWRKPRFIGTIPGRGYRFLPTYEGGAEASSSP